MPATSQLDKLISITAISVLSCFRTIRDWFRSFGFCIGGLHRSYQRRWIQFPRRRPIASPLEVCVRRPRCAPLHLHGAGIRKPSQQRKSPLHSITSSARPSSESGTVRPSAFAVLRLMISSALVDCWTGRSAGFSPLRIRFLNQHGSKLRVGGFLGKLEQRRHLTHEIIPA